MRGSIFFQLLLLHLEKEKKGYLDIFGIVIKVKAPLHYDIFSFL